MGSSTTEVFDYLFGKNPAYHPFWAAGWTARGLRKASTKNYLVKILSAIPRDSVVILNFGTVDVEFSARFKCFSEGFYDLKGLVAEAVDGILNIREFLTGLGFTTVLPAFVSPVIEYPQTFWSRVWNTGRQLPSSSMSRMYHAICREVSNDSATLDGFQELSYGDEGHYLMKNEFKRVRDDHHGDYIAMLEPVSRIVAAAGITLPPRQPALTALYPHRRVRIDDLIKAGNVRRSTCR